ncbi:TPA: DUF3085 domain-containing protein [Yersinia enterocolitica]
MIITHRPTRAASGRMTMPGTAAIRMWEKVDIYLMAEKGAYLDGRRQHIAYADDFDPRLPENEDWYENASLEVGHDDFGEFLGRDFWETFINQVLHKGCDVFFDVSENKIRAGYLEP